MTTPRCGTLFHFTHLDHLPDIFERGRLFADTEVRRLGLLQKEAGDAAIKDRRRRRRVTCPPGGVVADYVPFYFAARSPMMLLLARGRVPTFAGDHRDLVYLVTDIDRAVSTGRACVVTDRNAAVGVAEFSNDLALLGDLSSEAPECDFIDWPLMNNVYWNDTPEYPDRMERRMAEFLAHLEFPTEALMGIAVQNEDNRQHVDALLQSVRSGIPCRVREHWYYD